MGQDGAGEDDVLLEADGDDEEGQALGQEHHGDGDAQLGGDDEAEEEGEDGGDEDASAEPEVGAHAAHGQEERDEGQVHGQVAEHHDDDVEGVGVLEQVEELDPGVVQPAGEAAAGVGAGGLHDPHLLLAGAVLRLARLLAGDVVGDLLGGGQELGGVGVGDGEGEGAVLGVGGQRVGGGGQ